MKPAESIDFTTTGSAHNRQVTLVAGPQLQPNDLVALAQGLSCWLWGIPAAMLLSIRELPFEWGIPFQVPLFVVPYLLVLTGAVKMARVRSPGDRWRSEAQRALILCIVAAYLTPFLFWWRRWPQSVYLMANVWLLVACGVALLAQVNRVVRTLGACLGDPALAAEAELFRAVVWIVLGLPTLAAIAFVITASVRTQQPVTTQFETALLATPSWGLALLLVPLSITLALVWRAKDLTLAHLKNTPLP